MIPYKDDNPTERFPFFTIFFIAVNIAVFFWSVYAGLEGVARSYGALPVSLVTLHGRQPIHPLLTVVTSMFLHGGLFHLAGNMLYLWIFGNNIEDRLGHVGFVLFYLAGGFAAAYSHALANSGSTMPMIGASGAVSAILGAYVLLYPRAHVYTLIFLGFFVQVVKLPALIVIGFWAIIQFVSGVAGQASMNDGGVAWFAHIGGFAFGLAAIKVISPRRRRAL